MSFDLWDNNNMHLANVNGLILRFNQIRSKLFFFFLGLLFLYWISVIAFIIAAIIFDWDIVYIANMCILGGVGMLLAMMISEFYSAVTEPVHSYDDFSQERSVQDKH